MIVLLWIKIISSPRGTDSWNYTILSHICSFASCYDTKIWNMDNATTFTHMTDRINHGYRICQYASLFKCGIVVSSNGQSVVCTLDSALVTTVLSTFLNCPLECYILPPHHCLLNNIKALGRCVQQGESGSSYRSEAN